MSRTIALQIELSAELIERIEQAAGPLRVVRTTEIDDAEIVCTRRTDPLRIANASSLRWVQTWGAGVEWLLVPEVVAREELVITNASGIHAQPIAEHVFGWLLSYVRNLHKADRQARQQKWDTAPLLEGLGTLSGKTLGVMGLGAIGLRIAEIGAAFGMNVIAYRRSAELVKPVQRVYGELLEFLAASDFVINTLPATAATRHLIGARELEAMPSHAFLVNIGRGSTLDTVALVDALGKGKLGGAALDVTDPEPLPPTHSLWKFDNVLITPHYAGSHPGYDAHATDIFVANLTRYLTGEPLSNLVHASRGY